MTGAECGGLWPARSRDGKGGQRPFHKRTAEIAAAFEKIGQTRGRNSQLNGSKTVAERGVALVTTIFNLVAGKRLLYRAPTVTTEVGTVGIAPATRGDVTPSGEEFFEINRPPVHTK